MSSMRSRTRSSIATAAGAVLLSLGLLTGCAMSSDSATPEPAGGAAPVDEAQQEQAQDPAANNPTVDDRALVTTGEMGITTGDVSSTTSTAEEVVSTLEGRIDSRSEQAGNRTTTDLTIRVPADDYEALIDELRTIGTVEYVSTDVEDVTMETVDLEARIASLEASVDSLRGMLAQATSVTDMLEVESTLSEREAELQSLRAQQTALADQVAMSTLHLTISNDELVNPTPDDEGGFLGGLQAGWNTLVGFFNGLITVIGFLLPGLVVLAIMAAIIFFVIRAIVRSRRSGRPVASGQPAMATADAGAEAGTATQARHPAAPGSAHPRGEGSQGPAKENPDGEDSDRA